MAQYLRYRYTLFLFCLLGVVWQSSSEGEDHIHTYKHSNVSNSACSLRPTNDEIRNELAVLLDEEVKLIEINLTFQRNGTDLMLDPHRIFHQPWKWIRTNGRHGQALLMLPFHYKVLSMGMLSIETRSLSAELKDEPIGCFGTLPHSKRVERLRTLLLEDFKSDEGVTGSLSKNEYVCIQRLKDKKNYGEFVYECCRYGPGGDTVCIDLTQSFWLNVLRGVLILFQVIVFLFCPLMLQEQFYNARNVQNSYIYELEDPISISVYVKEPKHAPGTDTANWPRSLTMKQLSAWQKFAKSISSGCTVNVPRNVFVNLEIKTLHLQVLQKRVISRTEVPVSVLTYLYNNFIRCKLRQTEPLKDCCASSFCGDCTPACLPVMSWRQFLQVLVKFMLLMLLPLPFYIRLMMYSLHERDEVQRRQEALGIRGLQEQFFTRNIVQYLSPLHPLLIITYVVYAIEYAGIRLLPKDLRRRFKFVFRKSFQDLKSIDYGQRIKEAITCLVCPLKNCGCLGCVCPGLIYWLFVIPFLLLVVCCKCVPIIFLTWTLVWNTKSIISELNHRRRGHITEYNTLAIGECDFLPGRFDKKSSAGQNVRLKMIAYVREVLLQVFVLICSIATICSVAVLLVESVAFFLELASLTLMGIIVNADQAMRYASLAFILWLYVHDIFKAVKDKYLTLGQSIIEQARMRVESKIKEFAKKPPEEQKNRGFLVKRMKKGETIQGPTCKFCGLKTIQEPKLFVDKNIEKPKLCVDDENELPRWEISNPLLFMDKKDNRYVSVKFFESFTRTDEAGCPGPILACLMQATLKVLSMVAFLAFVFIVVMVFGESHNISTTNQTLATVVGGSLPFLLRKLIFSEVKDLTLDSFAFEYLFDNIAKDHSKKWEISDIMVEPTQTDNGEPSSGSSISDGQHAPSPPDLVIDLTPDEGVEIITVSESLCVGGPPAVNPV